MITVKAEFMHLNVLLSNLNIFNFLLVLVSCLQLCTEHFILIFIKFSYFVATQLISREDN